MVWEVLVSKLYYDWLAEEMVKRVGQPPVGVSYPVWAWHTQNGIQKKPDLRRERWGNGWKGDRFACIEIDIPKDKVLLSDFDAWSIILNNGLLSESEQEDLLLGERYNSLLPNQREDIRNILFFTAAKPKGMPYKTVYNVTNSLIVERNFK